MTAVSCLIGLAVAAPSTDALTVERRPGPPWVDIYWTLSVDEDPESQPGLTAAAAQVWAARAGGIVALTHTVRVEAEHGRIRMTAGVPASRLATVLDAATAAVTRLSVSDVQAEAALAQAQALRRAETLDELALAHNAVRSVLFADSPWARPTSGTLRGLATITSADLSAFFHRHLVGGRLAIQLVGAVPDDFDWRPKKLPPGRGQTQPQAPPPPQGRRLILIDKPGTQRAVVAVARWPATAAPSCQSAVETRDLGQRRVMWWTRRHPDEIEAALSSLLTETASSRTSDDCLADAAAVRWADGQLDRGPPGASRSSASTKAESTTVVVAVLGVKAGLAETLSRLTGIEAVSVIPYDLP